MGTSSIMGPWLILTSQWIGYTGVSVSLAFLLCGILCIPIALCYGELASMFKTRGGSYEYVRAAYNREAGYWVSWTTMFTYIVLICFQIICVTMLIQYIAGEDFAKIVVIGIAVSLMILMTVLNTRNLSVATTLQVVMFFVLVAAGVVTMICFVGSSVFGLENIGPFFQNGIMGRNDIIGMDAGFVLAVAALVTMFFGFELIPQFAGEANYPANKHWKLMLGGIVFVIAFDALICFAEIGMRSIDSSMTSFEYISSLYAGNGMVSAVFAEAYVGPWLQYAVVVANFCAMGCGLIGFWMGASRILHSMGSSGSLPKMFGKANKHGMPSTGNYFVLAMVFVLVMIALSGPAWINATFSLMALGVGFTYFGVSMAFLKMKKAKPRAARPWKAPGGNAVGYIAAGASLFMILMMVYTVVSSAASGDYTMAAMSLVFFGIIGVIRYLMKRDMACNPDRYVEDVVELEGASEPAAETIFGVTGVE
ncbi:MAG: APC family permease [Candidatus Methanoplasma sp.]|nr:APC family permease [Candidatus Methanoplasma sp.]